ncbi:OmpL47-type beta-barrel domain-containing protein [Paractinoplanes durhamensis]|uniref:OmpL47-type beta-barrel domain-containing protein n=1 Tax=Paractinoplanes durhamensis TaxID=113563 RepID=UPI00362D58A2
MPVTFGTETLQVPVYWDPVTTAEPGTFPVAGDVLGYAAGKVTATVTVISPGDTEGDVTAPTLTLTPSGSAGTNGWYRSSVKVRAAGVDDRGGRMTISTVVDGGAAVAVDSVRYADVTVTGDGQHTVTATATDRAGNRSAAASLPVKIDAAVPVSTGTVADRAVTVTATDATSGVARIEYAIDTGAWAAYAGPIAAPDASKHTVSFRATDNAGNLETARTATIPADLSAPLSGNVGPIAVPTASYTAGWNSVGALNDNADVANPGQAQIWGTWSGTRPATQWIQYDWARPIRFTGAELKFWRDSAKGTGDGVAEPDGWKLQYWDGAAWQDVLSPRATEPARPRSTRSRSRRSPPPGCGPPSTPTPTAPPTRRWPSPSGGRSPTSRPHPRSPRRRRPGASPARHTSRSTPTTRAPPPWTSRSKPRTEARFSPW